jgi:3-hydroxymyristoyl/3-hydroxydecanoyl-(acyl carrier protein) dehydratase
MSLEKWFINKIVEYEEGKRCVGLKQVSGNEPFFQGHFPNYAVMPGVLITGKMVHYLILALVLHTFYLLHTLQFYLLVKKVVYVG